MMSIEVTEPTGILPMVESRPRGFPRWVRDAVLILIGIASGFESSYLRPGPRGHVGPRSAQGLQGVQGVAGAPGSAASAQHLGVRVNTSTWTSTNGGVSPLVFDVFINSPQKSKDGTVSSAVGNFVSVSPQSR
jgi:hypothetical protein